MAYRTVDEPLFNCQRHPQAEVAATCQRCARLLCLDCIRRHRGRLVCGACEREGRSGRRVRALLIVAVLGVLAVPLFALRPGGAASADEADTYNAWFIRQLLEHPCSRDTTLTVIRHHQLRGDHARASAVADNYLRGCREDRSVRWERYVSDRERDSDDEQLADLTRMLIQSKDAEAYRRGHDDGPYWPEFDFEIYLLRARLREKVGALEGAAEDYEAALMRAPALWATPMALSHVYVKMRRPCAAIGALRRFVHLHDGPDRAALEGRIAELRRERTCSVDS